jgi:hypothetical protein
MQKEGLGHIEMILAFVLFVGFLFFGLYFFNPLSADRLLDSSVDYASREIIKNTSLDTLTYSLVINASDPSLVALPISALEVPSGSSFLVLDSKGKVLPSQITGIFLSFDRGSDRFVKIIVGSFAVATTNLSMGEIIPLENYTISSSESERLTSETSFKMLKERYDLDYVALKKDFNLPGRVDFSFSAIFSDENNVTATQFVPEGLEALSKQERIEVLMEDGTVEFADLLVRVW